MIPYGKHHLDEDDILAVVSVLRSGSLTQGPIVDSFENAMAEYVGAKYAVVVSSATAALHLANIVVGVQSDNAIVTSPITFVATANAARYCGGRVLFADVNSDDINLSVKALEKILSNNAHVRAVVPVHFAGLPCDMDAIKKMADFAGAAVIEDAAHSLGATYPDGKRVGCCNNSLMTIFSLHPVKAIAAGEGGVITTNDEAIYRKLLRLRSHGINKVGDLIQRPSEAFTNSELNPWYYEMQELGFNFRITDIQCALALSQLTKLDSFVRRRRDLVQRYDDAFQSTRICRPAQIFGRDQSGHHLYVLRIDFKSLRMTRGDLMRKLKSRGIGTQVHYIPVPLHPYYRELGYSLESYPNAKSYYEEALTIPLFYDLTDEQQGRVIEAFQEVLTLK